MESSTDNRPKILIVVSGGVAHLNCDDLEIDVMLFDFDCEGETPQFVMSRGAGLDTFDVEGAVGVAESVTRHIMEAREFGVKNKNLELIQNMEDGASCIERFIEEAKKRYGDGS